MRLIVKIEGTKLQLINIYGPKLETKSKSEAFFKGINNHMLDDVDSIMFGDFNMVEDLELDRQGGTLGKFTRMEKMS